MMILYRRLMRRLGGWIQLIGLKIEAKGYISHDTSQDYDLGRSALFVNDPTTGELVPLHDRKDLRLIPIEENES